MAKKLSWLHFSDLHFGQNSQKTLLPKIAKDLLKDLDYLHGELGNIDVVFFTGDLTQKGAREEFDALTDYLKMIWEHFNKLGSNPYLIAIPGNHDLLRPDLNKAAARVLHNYHLDRDFQESFWSGLSEKNEYYELIDNCFLNFTEWYRNVDLPKPDYKTGLVPGDISLSITLNDINLKIIGLNTAFLELGSGDYKEKLIINPLQLHSLTSGDFFNWIESSDISILMTHHDIDWLDRPSRDYYNNDINPTNTFHNHICGHLHEPKTYEYGLLGSGLRRLQIAPSLFGLEKVNDTTERIHGYVGGFYVINDNNQTISERFYPRKATKRYDGSFGIAADNGFNLEGQAYIEKSHSLSLKTSGKPEKTTASLQMVSNPGNVLSFKQDREQSTDLDRIPRASYFSLPQHLNIRLVEQQNFTKILQEDRFVWLVTDWGLDETGFIGSVAANFSADRLKNAFILNCEDLNTIDEFLSSFEDQFEMALQRFCNIVIGVSDALLVLNHVNSSLYSPSQTYHKFISIIDSIIDFCPEIHVIIICRLSPQLLDAKKYVKLSPLDSSEVKNYIKGYSFDLSELELADNFFKLLEITNGLPKHINRIVEKLRIASFEEILESEKEKEIDTTDVSEVPKSLRQTISNLANATDRIKTRSFKLLKILTILEYGETITNLKKFEPTEPIYIDNANELEQLSVVEVITTTKILSKVSGSSGQQIKIIRTPRHIRDYINTIITDDERKQIINHACDMYFGGKWRNGVYKDIYAHTPVFGESKFFNVDNCHIVINGLISIARKNEKEPELKRAINLAIAFSSYARKHGDYRNTINITEELYTILKNGKFNRLHARNTKLLGEALRMAGNRERSGQMLKEALEISDSGFSNDDINAIHYSLGLMYVSTHDFAQALACVKEIEKTARPNGLASLQAKCISASCTSDKEELLKKLKKYETQATKSGFTKLANNLSLEIVTLETDLTNNEKRLRKIIETGDGDYNKVRAIVKISLNILTSTDDLISTSDLILLSRSYSYLYAQRLDNLFKNCHKALWIYCTREKRIPDLLNLYKHSSLIWRISGDLDLEKEYFIQLAEFETEIMKEFRQNSPNLVNINYYIRRKIEFGN